MLITRTLGKSVYQKCNILISQPKHMVWVLKRSLNETVLLSTQKNMLKLMGKKIFIIFHSKIVFIKTYRYVITVKMPIIVAL